MFERGWQVNALKAWIRDSLAELLFNVGVSTPAKVCQGRLLILTFHRVLPGEIRALYPLPGLAVTPEELHWILATLLPHFEVHTVSDAVRVLKEGHSRKPLIAISFDDGQWDNLAYAVPVLSAFDVRATFYVPTDYIESEVLLWHDMAAFAWQGAAPLAKRAALAAACLSDRLDASAGVSSFLEGLKAVPPEMRQSTVTSLNASAARSDIEWARLMKWSEVTNLARMGHEIGSHSCSHALLPQLSAEAQRSELAESMRMIEAYTGQRPISMCYPNGSYDSRSIEIAAAVGYENAVTTKWGINDSDRPEFELLRCDMDARRLVNRRGSLSRARLAMRISGFQPGLAA